MESVVPLVDCPDVIRSKLFKNIYPADLRTVTRASETAAGIFGKFEKQKAIVDAHYSNGDMVLTTTTADGIVFDEQVLFQHATHYDFHIRHVRIEWGAEDKRRAHQKIFSALYFIPKSLARVVGSHKSKIGCETFYCNMADVIAHLGSNQGRRYRNTIAHLEHTISSFQPTQRVEFDGAMFVPRFNMLPFKLFHLRAGAQLFHNEFIGLNVEVGYIQLHTDNDLVAGLGDRAFNSFLADWKNNPDELKYLEFKFEERGDDNAPVGRAKIDTLLNKLGAVEQAGKVRELELEGVEEKKKIVGGWDVKANDGRIGTILRSRGLFVFAVFPVENKSD